MSDYISRGVPITDLEVQGRTVTAYAAVFNQPAEITDGHGHYMETIDPRAFNRTIKGAGAKAGVFYNHGMTIHGTPSESGSIPIGVPTSITADRKGLLTVSRYNGTPMADAVLEAMRDGAIPGYSFTGRIIRSSPERLPRARGGELPTITRTELGLKEYGPTPFPAYTGAEIVSVRSAMLAGHAMMSEDELAEKILNLLLTRATRASDPVLPVTAPAPDDASDSPSHSERNRILIRDRIMRSGVLEWTQPASSSATAVTDDPSTPSEAEPPADRSSSPAA
jgi:uncharacterized protein